MRDSSQCPYQYQGYQRSLWLRFLTRFNKFGYSSILILLLFLVFYMINTLDIFTRTKTKTTYSTKSFNNNIVIENLFPPIKKRNISEIKYILLWTDSQASPFNYFGRGRSLFLKKNCTWTNCYVTSDRNYLGHYTEFDVIAFNGPQLSDIYHIQDIPRRRDDRQKYVYANIESAANYPIHSDLWDRFFNWTWTYKLNSDAVWGYFLIRNASNHVVGPAVNMTWIKPESMDSIDEQLKGQLSNKTKAAAWFSSYCHTASYRESFVDRIQQELKKYKLQVDIFGACGTHVCHRSDMEKCLQLLGNHYFFYFAFENAFSEDYVTEKVVYALNHYTVPVVYGGANYSRFLPEGSYLDGVKLGPAKLANTIHDLMQNSTAYHEYFRWRNHYSFHFRNEDPKTDDYCNFCSMLNDDRMIQTTVYDHFNSWWSGGIVEPPPPPSSSSLVPISSDRLRV